MHSFQRLIIICIAVAAMTTAAMTLALATGRLPAYRSQVTDAAGNTVTLYVEEEGQGRPLVLIHGLGASIYTWRRMRAGLARTHRVIALDLKGFGRSEKPFDQAYSAGDQADLVASFIRKHELWDVTLIGHSFGGAVAARTALRLEDEPRRVRNLVIISAPVLPGVLPQSFDYILVPGAPEALLTPLPPSVVARQLLTTARGTSSGITDADIAGYAKPYYELGAKHAFITTARAIVGDKDRTITAKLRTLQLPALLIWCKRDDIVPLKGGRQLAKVLPDVELEVLTRCNHLPHERRPQTTRRLIETFLERH